MGQNSDRRARILLINPNSNEATTTMMVAIARSAAADGFDIVGATATRAPTIIVSADALEAAALEVEEIARLRDGECDGVIVSAFGDPGLAGIKATMKLPAVGIGESAMLEAAGNGRRFGVATTTPLLKAKIDALPDTLGLRASYTGTRFADGDPQQRQSSPRSHLPCDGSFVSSRRNLRFFRAAASAVLRKTVFLDMNSAVLDV
ncbi:aspartate/glutamate racemase family protein [Bradyrhizobium yuanmingense]|uniref:aspartate/glutamate racemase family protein n=1 Tax=Bradyrhizobium yuanmingense TaxID=108015 RepID=UPI000A5C434C|nr:aspartate/glutamate racemase family protein [Bradyrhizobium yuanmingense]